MDSGLIIAGSALIAVFLAARYALRPIMRQRDVEGMLKTEPHDSLKRDVAHESGHAWFCHNSRWVMTVGEIRVSHVTGSCVNFLRIRHERNDPHMLWDHVVISLAGIAAETVVYGSFSAPRAVDDLRMAAQSARLLMRHEETQGAPCPPPWRPYEEKPSLFDPQEHATGEVHPEVRAIMQHAFGHALHILTKERAQFDTLRVALFRSKQLDGEQLTQLLGPRTPLATQSMPPGEPPPHP